MGSLDVDSLFIHNIYLQIFTNIIDNLYNGSKNLPNIPKHDFPTLLNITTNESVFMFKNKYHKKADVIAMGSSLDPWLDNIFMCRFESRWLRHFPVFYRC